MQTTNQNDVLIINVWPEPSSDVGRSLYPNCKPISDEREEDVWDRLRNLTINPNVRRNILVMTSCERDMAEVREEFLRGDCCPSRIEFLKPFKEKVQRWHANTNSKKEVEIVTPFTLASAVDAKKVAEMCLSGKHSALLIWHPRGYEDHGLDGDDLRHLSYLKEQGVKTPIYVFHDRIHPEKWGVEIDGDANRAYRKHGNWEDAFPPLADVEFSPQEVIVDEMLIKGNIHVLSAAPESYKTMQLIELSSAVLEQRPVFDLLKVNARYPSCFSVRTCHKSNSIFTQHPSTCENMVVISV